MVDKVKAAMNLPYIKAGFQSYISIRKENEFWQLVKVPA